MSFSVLDFRSEQKKYARVRKAYTEKEKDIIKLLKSKSIEISQLEIYLRAFKTEEIIELWVKNKNDEQFIMLKEFDICSSSGKIGPKRIEGDRQVPEGFYHIQIFNPASSFYLSLGLNYPNKSDLILSDKKRPGNDIYIHGSCVTIGCIPLTDDIIKELYVFCVEAKNNGQLKIPVTIFPAKLGDNKYNALKIEYTDSQDELNLWESLKTDYDKFETTKKLSSIQFLSNGKHIVK